MTAPDIVALRELLAKATPGPYKRTSPGVDCWPGCAPSWRDRRVIQDHLKGDKHARVVADTMRAPDAALIVAAVNALPALLDRIEQLERERDAAQGDAERYRLWRRRAVADDEPFMWGEDLDQLPTTEAEVDAAIDAARSA